MCRLQQLSFESGVIRSEGNTHTSGLVSTENCRHVSTSAAKAPESAAFRTDWLVFGVSMSLACLRRWPLEKRVPVFVKITPRRVSA